MQDFLRDIFSLLDKKCTYIFHLTLKIFAVTETYHSAKSLSLNWVTGTEILILSLIYSEVINFLFCYNGNKRLSLSNAGVRKPGTDWYAECRL